jgi:hypothetical protein
MGNMENGTTQYPAAFGATGTTGGRGWGIIAVGATNRNDGHHFESNTGNHIDVAAPGVQIKTTSAYSPYYVEATGTSLSAPAVSGLAGLLRAHDPTLTSDDVEHLIRYSCDPPAGGWNTSVGEGRINARRALEYTSPVHFYRDVTTTTPSVGPRESSNFPFTMLLQFVNARAVNNDGALRQLTNAEYYCGYRRTVTQSVSIPNTPFTDVSKLRIWCRGTREAPGTSLDGELVAGTQPNYGYGYGEVVPESVTLNGGTLSFTLRTFIYELTGYLGGCSSLPDGVLWVPRRGGEVA